MKKVYKNVACELVVLYDVVTTSGVGTTSVGSMEVKQTDDWVD